MSDFESARFMGRFRWSVAGAIVGLAIGLWAPRASAVFTEEVRTEGEIPIDLNGVWLMVSTLEFPNGLYTTLPHIYRITHIPMKIAKQLSGTPRPTPFASEDEGRILLPTIPGRRIPGDDIDVMFLDVELPAPLAAKVEKLQREKKPWVPDEEELKLVAERWSDLKPRDPSEYARVEYRIVAEKNFDDPLKIDEATKGAKLALIANQTTVPGKQSTGGNVIFVWGVREVKPGRFEGTLVRSHMTGSPFPVAITSKGKFVMYKLADVSREWETEAGASASPTPPVPSPTPEKPAGERARAK